MMIFTVAGRELRTLFLSPLAWGVAGVVTFIMAWIFLGNLSLYLQYQPQILQMGGDSGATALVGMRTLGTVSIILLMVVPLLSMRSFAEERRAGTLPLLFASPASMLEITLGKYFGLLAFVYLMLAVIGVMPALLGFGTALDWGHLAAGLLGLALQMAMFAAVGVFGSAITRHAPIAAVVPIGFLLLMWLIDIGGQGASKYAEEVGAATKYLSMHGHLGSFLEGRFSSEDALYFVLIAGFFLALTVRRLDAERLQD